MFCEFSDPDSTGSRTCPRCSKQTRHAGVIQRHCPATRPGSTHDTSCAHRGQVTRTVACASCNKSTIELPVYACAMHGECTLADYSRSSADLDGVRACDRCPDRRPGRSPEGTPSVLRRAGNFAGALWRDWRAGRPRRPAELVARLFDRHCAPCPKYNNGQCGECGCPVARLISERNKLAWAKESCPLGKWPVNRLNLLFYILPLKNPANVWQWHVAELKKRLHHFNGRKLITIATPGPDNRLAIDPAENVIAAFGDPTIEFLLRPNDPHHWETPAFREMLSMIESRNENEASFYFHAKGVRRANQTAIRPWCEAIYANNLDRLEEVREILAGYPCCGIAKIPQNPANFPGGGNWHFAGTGFWFNHRDLFSRPNWRQINDHSHAVEGYLSTQFDAQEAYCLAYEGTGNVYSAATWAVPAETPVSVIVTARNNGQYLNECLTSCLAQTRPAAEVIYCDDASTDDSLTIARGLPVKVIVLEKNQGVERARNHAADQATGRALLFVDGDNRLPPNYLERMVAKLTPATPFVYPDLKHFGAVNRYDRMPEWGERDLAAGNFCDTCSLMWADDFRSVGGWKPGYGHLADWHLFLRLARRGAPARAGVALDYRDHEASMSAQTKGRLTPAELTDLERRVVSDA